MTGRAANRQLVETNEEEAIAHLIRFARGTQTHDLVLPGSGSVSVRMGTERFAVSASGIALADISPDHVSLVAVEDGRHLAGPRPSREFELHRRAYMIRPLVGAVARIHSPSATVVACMPDPPRNLDFFPEVPLHIRAHAYVPYSPLSEPDLASNLAIQLQDRAVRVLQIANYGQLVVGSTWQNVLRRASIFERACWMATRLVRLGTLMEGESTRLRGVGKDYL